MEIVKIYGPIFSSLALLFFAFRANFGNDIIFSLERWSTKIEFTNTNVGRAAFLVVALSILSYYLYMDYSQFFPRHLEMEVFYDREGIKRSLNAFSKEELAELGYKGEDTSLVISYYTSLDKRLQDILSYTGFFTLEHGVVHSEGEASFKVEQTEGIHNYYIAESKGHLTHVLEAPGRPRISFLSFFDTIPSSNDYIRPSIDQIVFNRELIISPRFKQIIAEKNKSDGVVFDHFLIGVTKVYLLPYPSFSNTVYFYDAGNKGIVPIGYAVYK